MATDRRAVGLLVVVLAFLLALVVPNLIGRGIPGTAQAVPVPEPPAVGACVEKAFDTRWNWNVADRAHYRYPDLSTGDCGRAHFGEVVSVIAKPVPPTVTETGDGSMSVSDKNFLACNDPAGLYLGLPDATGHPPALLFGHWGLVVSVGFLPLAPTERQRAAGARWLACAMYLVDQRDMAGEKLVRYEGTLRDAISTGVGRDYFGFCPAGTNLLDFTTHACRQPHRAEMFATGSVSQDIPRATLMQSCTKLVEQVTKRPDLTHEGRLVVSVQAMGQDGNPVAGATIPKDSVPLCGVLATDGRMMRGSLIAIGSDPIPWA